MSQLSFAILRATNVCLRGSRTKWRSGTGFDDGARLPYMYILRCVCVCVCVNVCLCVYLHTVIFANWTILMYVHAICYVFIVHILIIIVKHEHGIYTYR